jgi:hypothetical protein
MNLIPSLKSFFNKYLTNITLENIDFSSSRSIISEGTLGTFSWTRFQIPLKKLRNGWNIEANLSSYNVEPFYAPRANAETKPRTL